MNVANVISMDGLFDRLKGTIYGQAIGDALGLGTEGMTDEDMAWKYPHGIKHYSDKGQRSESYQYCPKLQGLGKW